MLRHWPKFNGAVMAQFRLRHHWNFPRAGDGAKPRAITPPHTGAPLARALTSVAPLPLLHGSALPPATLAEHRSRRCNRRMCCRQLVIVSAALIADIHGRTLAALEWPACSRAKVDSAVIDTAHLRALSRCRSRPILFVSLSRQRFVSDGPPIPAARALAKRLNASFDRVSGLFDRGWYGGGASSAARSIIDLPVLVRRRFSSNFSSARWTIMTPGLIRTSADWIPVLRGRITELRLSHLEVDHLAGLADGHTSKILNGKKLRADTLMRLLSALGLAVSAVVESK
jgi:hypothetical protein